MLSFTGVGATVYVICPGACVVPLVVRSLMRARGQVPTTADSTRSAYRAFSPCRCASRD